MNWRKDQLADAERIEHDIRSREYLHDCLDCRRERQFNPETDVPKTDQEVEIALQRDNDILTKCLIGIYRVRRMQGDDILKAYKDALLAHIGKNNQLG